MFTFPAGFHKSGVGGVFSAKAADFDGTSDQLERGGALTSATDTALGTISFWVKFDGGDGVIQYMYESTGSKISIGKLAANTFWIQINSPTGSLVTWATSETFTVADGWIHILASWDQSGGTVNHLYINDVVAASAPVFDVTGVADWTSVEHSIGYRFTFAGNYLNGCLADMYMNNVAYLDLSITANRRKFIDASGKPVDLGVDGSTPTGSQPIIFMSGDSTDFENNLGFGGAFAVTGALTNCADSPSD